LATPLRRRFVQREAGQTTEKNLVAGCATTAWAERLPILIGAPVEQWMDIHVAAFTNCPVARGGGQLHALRHLRKHRRSRSGHAPLQTLVLQPLDAASHIGTQRLRHGLKIVVSEFQDFLEVDHPNCLGIFSRFVNLRTAGTCPSRMALSAEVPGDFPQSGE